MRVSRLDRKGWQSHEVLSHTEDWDRGDGPKILVLGAQVGEISSVVELWTADAILANHELSLT